MGNVFISPNPKKESVQIDIDGNEVIPFTKQVIKKNEDAVEKPVEKPNEDVVEKPIEPPKNESILPGEQV